MTDITFEYFDIVDEHNNPLGTTKLRTQVHAQMTDWHRVTGIWLQCPDGKFLCQQRSLHKDVHPGMWQLTFGGHLKAGETYEQSAVGELQEELGLTIDPVELIPLGTRSDPEHKHHAKLFLYRWYGTIADLHFNDGEVSQVKVVSIDEYKQMLESGQNVHRINPVLLAYLNK